MKDFSYNFVYACISVVIFLSIFLSRFYYESSFTVVKIAKIGGITKHSLRIIFGQKFGAFFLIIRFQILKNVELFVERCQKTINNLNLL